MNHVQQLFIVLCVLMILPVLFTLLSKLHLVPVAMYFLATRLVFPDWAAENRLLCAVLFCLCVLYAVGLWLLWLRNRKIEQQIMLCQLRAKAVPLWELEDMAQK